MLRSRGDRISQRTAAEMLGLPYRDLRDLLHGHRSTIERVQDAVVHLGLSQAHFERRLMEERRKREALNLLL